MEGSFLLEAKSKDQNSKNSTKLKEQRSKLCVLWGERLQRSRLCVLWGRKEQRSRLCVLWAGQQKMGAMGIHAHDRLLGGTKRDRLLARSAELKHAKELEEEPPEPAAFTTAALGGSPGPSGLTAAQANKRLQKYAGGTVLSNAASDKFLNL